MANFQEIESALIAINETSFQELCDDYLFWSEEEYPDMNRPGTQKGKKKTKKGTPDTFWILPNEKYVFAEYTTKNRKDGKVAFLKKLKDDLKKCISPAITNIELNKIQKIILCFNSEILPGEIEELKKVLSKTRIILQIKSLDTIARDIYGRFQHLAPKHLDLQIDTGQFLKPKNFTEEYASGASLSTPLDNKFFFREDELLKINNELQAADIIILTGAPGVGKSKLALAAINEWIKPNASYEAYCISNKYVQIYEDLKSYIKNGRDYILMIDDANRQSQNLLQILSYSKNHKKGRLKIIVTVRDYAFDFIKLKCNGLNFSSVSLSGFTDEQLKEILQSDDFKVTNHIYTNRILEIAKGNPRVAIMAAKLAIKHQKIDALYDLFEFYDTYFHSFISDNEVFGENPILKTLGIISFFYSVDVSNKSFYERLLSDFEITHYDFTEAAAKLERMELLESTSDNSIIRISDQVLSAYFFYKTFLKDKSLDFTKLLFNYFESQPNRFRDTIIPANNDFGYEKVLKPVEQILSDYLEHISVDASKVYKYLDIFWFYLKEETFAFIHKQITKLPVIENPVFIVDKKNNNHNWDEDKNLALLSKFFYQSVKDIIIAIELTFDYLDRKPDLYKDVFKKFSDIFGFSYEDERLSFYRQAKFIETLTQNANKKNPGFLQMFYDVVPVLLKTNFTVHGGSWKKNTISFYHYNLPASEVVMRLRAKIWKHFAKIYGLKKSKAEEALYEYIQPSIDIVKEVLEFDLPFLLEIINKQFSTANFLNCYFVQKLIERYAKLKITHESFAELKIKFYSKPYKIYKLVDGSRLRNKEDYEYENINFDKFERLKEIEIRYNLRVANIKEFTDFYKLFTEISTTPHIQSWNFNNALDILIHETYLADKKLAFKCLLEIQKSGNKVWYFPHKILSVLNEDTTKLFKFYTTVLKSKFVFPNRHGWVFAFTQFVKPEFVRKEYYEELLATYESLAVSSYFDFSYLGKFIAFNSGIYASILKIFVDKANQKLSPRLDFHFYEKYLHHFSSDLTLPKKAYYISEQVEQYFDHDCKDFLSLLKLDNAFLLEYLSFIAKDKYSLFSREYVNLSIIWQLDNAEELIESAFKFLKDGKFYLIDGHFSNSFFKNLTDDKKERAIKFLTAYQKGNSKNIEVTNMILDIYRHSLNDNYHTAIDQVLKLNSNVEFFKKTKLLPSSFSSSGDVIWDDVKAEELNRILGLLNKLPKPYQYSQHKAYLKAWINNCKKNAEMERKRKFMDDRW